MKKIQLLLTLFIFSKSFCQGEQLYADGTDTDQDGNTFEWINFDSQDWSIENSDVVTYRDGTEIPQVNADIEEWGNLTTGAWCYYENDPTKGKLYNWYAVMGIHDNDPNTPNKEFAPEGWRIPSENDMEILRAHLIANQYNHDLTVCDNKVAKSMASISGWNSSVNYGAVGNEQSLNNRSGFNAYAVGYCSFDGLGGEFNGEGQDAKFWSSSLNNSSAKYGNLSYGDSSFMIYSANKFYGLSVRFVRDAQTASINEYSTVNFNIFPNPSKDYLNIDNRNLKIIIIYDIFGKELIKVSGKNKIDVSLLSEGVYIIKVFDGINSSTKKFIKE